MKRTNGPSPSRTVRPSQGNVPYPVEVEAAYTLKQGRRIVEKGHVKTVGVSRTDLLLDSGSPLPLGMDVELIADWPSAPNAGKGMVVRIKGKTVRGPANEVAVRIARYDFEVLPERASGTPQQSAKTVLSQITPLAS